MGSAKGLPTKYSQVWFYWYAWSEGLSLLASSYCLDNILLLLLLPCCTPFGVWDWPWGQCIACQLFKRGDWVGYTQSTLLPQQLLGRTVAWAIEPAFHWWGLVGQFATGHRHLPQFWISAKSITINLGAVSLCARSPPRGGLQPWASLDNIHICNDYHHHLLHSSALLTLLLSLLLSSLSSLLTRYHYHYHHQCYVT